MIGTAMYEYRARLHRVVDADTVLMMIDQGFETYRIQRVRLADIDAPEEKTPEGKDATKFLEDWFSEMSKGEWPFLLRSKRVKYDRYHRYIASIHTMDGQHDLSAELVESGHAVWKNF